MRHLAAVFAALSLSACMTSTAIPPSELARLDGYTAADPARAQQPLEALDGGRVVMRPGSTLSLEGPGGRVGGRFSSIVVRDGVFSGQMANGRSVSAPLATIRAADVSRTDVTRTALIVSAALVVFGLAAFAWELSLAEPTHPVNGRALRLARVPVLAPPASPDRADGWRADAPAPDAAGLPDDARAFLAASWTEAARAEHASVPAFSRLSLSLIALGAPAPLVAAAHRAALDEIEHARRTFALAAAYGAPMPAPGPIGALRDAPAVTASSLPDLAAESLLDGCFLEGVAAAAAAEALARASDAAVRDALTQIAADERGHAELAWEIVAWCCDAGGAEAKRRVRVLASRLPTIASPPEAPPRLHAALAAHGWLPPLAFREIARRTRREVEARAAALAVAPSDPIAA